MKSTEDDHKTYGGNVYKQLLINSKLQLEREIKKQPGWKKSVTGAEDRAGL